jgi:hypothetical protein
MTIRASLPFPWDETYFLGKCSEIGPFEKVLVKEMVDLETNIVLIIDRYGGVRLLWVQ